MKIIKTKLYEVFIIKLEQHEDPRGSFMRSFCVEELKKNGIDFKIAQINLSFNKKIGTFRGLHYQKSPKEEDKIVYVQRGKIYDIVVDLRVKSPTYKKWIGIFLEESKFESLYIPKGCAHGFLTLENDTNIEYLMSEYYSKEHATGLNWREKSLNIKLPGKVKIISEKDEALPYFT